MTSPQRLVAAPELSTVAEAGFPGLTNQGTIGPVAPAGTPVAIIEQIAQAVRTVLAEADYRQQLIDFGFRSQSRYNAREIPASARSRCADSGHR